MYVSAQRDVMYNIVYVFEIRLVVLRERKIENDREARNVSEVTKYISVKEPCHSLE